jgi:AAA ATPase domain
MPDQRTVRIFISSPADVRPERLKAERIVARIAREFAYHFAVEALLWEREPLVALHHFQDPENIPQPRGTDIVVVILWSQLGVPLPANKFRGAISGRPVTGTEWEFEDALAGARESGIPDLLLYRKTARISADLDDEAELDERRRQRALVQDFIGRWFRAEDGKGYTAASHSFAATAEFEEQLYEHLRALLERRAGARAEGVAIRWSNAPYRGLLSFDYEQAPVFFGRTRARNELRELLAARAAAGCAFVLVLGASGSGKSSLVKAGLLPDLALPGMIGRVALVRRAVLRPSDAVRTTPHPPFDGEGRSGGEPTGDPIDALAAAILSETALPELAGLEYTAERLAALLREAPGQAAFPIRQGLAAAGAAARLTEAGEARLVLVIDQLEEMFTVEGFDDSARARFVAALDALARSGLVWVVATMRSDFFDRLELLPPLAALSAGEARFLLLPPDRAEIGQVIREPAREAGLGFEFDKLRGVGLDEVIREAAAQAPDALPLLSFLLDQLWQRRTLIGELSFAAYDALGGLEGALSRRAEEVVTVLPEQVQAALPRLLRALVTVGRGPDAPVVAQSTARDRFSEGSPESLLVDAFLRDKARLLVGDEDDKGRPRIRLAHEALLTHWERVQNLLADDKINLARRRRLEEAEARWRLAVPKDRAGLMLRPGLELGEAEALLSAWESDIDTSLRDYVALSLNAERRRVRRRHLALAASLAAAVVFGVVAVLAVSFWQSAEHQKFAAVANLEIAQQLSSHTLSVLRSQPEFINLQETYSPQGTYISILDASRDVIERYSLTSIPDKLIYGLNDTINLLVDSYAQLTSESEIDASNQLPLGIVNDKLIHSDWAKPSTYPYSIAGMPPVFFDPWRSSERTTKIILLINNKRGENLPQLLSKSAETVETLQRIRENIINRCKDNVDFQYDSAVHYERMGDFNISKYDSRLTRDPAKFYGEEIKIFLRLMEKYPNPELPLHLTHDSCDIRALGGLVQPKVWQKSLAIAYYKLSVAIGDLPGPSSSGCDAAKQALVFAADVGDAFVEYPMGKANSNEGEPLKGGPGKIRGAMNKHVAPFDALVQLKCTLMDLK